MKKQLIQEYLLSIDSKNKKSKAVDMQKSIAVSLRKKRLFDIAVILLSMPFLIPILIMIIILVKVDSRGAAFYTSKRVGKNGKIFDFYKFRSMVVDAESLKTSLNNENESNDGVIFKIKNDPRITRVGRVLRKLSLDELPQLLNVLKGDMSLVGPRPPIVSEVKDYQIEDYKRLHFIPGLTCIWQISGRSDVPFNKQVEMDLDYIKDYKLRNDFKILLLTIPAVFKGSGAY
jgi:lipopolysaccharide/colanic/teichoic acid biosynthesis glycosyltransferase